MAPVMVLTTAWYGYGDHPTAASYCGGTVSTPTQAVIVQAWERLPAVIRQGILAMVKAAANRAE